LLGLDRYLVKPGFAQQVLEPSRKPGRAIIWVGVKRDMERNRDLEMPTLFEHPADVFGGCVQAVEMFPDLVASTRSNFLDPSGGSGPAQMSKSG